MDNTIKVRSGISIPRITRQTAEAKNYLTRKALFQMHLMPNGDPVAYEMKEDGTIIYYFDPEKVLEAPPELWYTNAGSSETMTLESGNIIEKMSVHRAAELGYYTKERLEQMKYETREEPVAYTIQSDGAILYFYDKHTAIRQPLMCVSCGKFVRYRHKLCKDCFEKELAVLREEGNRYRNTSFGMDRSKVLFFDLELTGVYNHDEIISISIIDGNHQIIMNTLVKPLFKKKWNRTEKIHGITPQMVADAPHLNELIPRLKEIFANADALIAFGVSTDYSHIKYIYETEEEQLALRAKTHCCANEFVRYLHENHPDLSHASLVDAMECLNIPWDGIPHSSMADTFACARVWEKLFPNYYK